MPFNLSIGEMFVLFVVALLMFGGRLPEVARKVGRSIGEFKRGLSDETSKLERSIQPEEKPPPDWTPPPDGDDCEGLSGP